MKLKTGTSTNAEMTFGRDGSIDVQLLYWRFLMPPIQKKRYRWYRGVEVYMYSRKAAEICMSH